MSTARPQTPTIPTRDEATLPSIVTRPIRAVAFWAAILVSLAYPVLLYGGVQGQDVVLLVAAVAVHVSALRLGRGYDPTT